MGFISDAIEDVGDFISDTVEAIVDNPIGALVSVGGMALGIPPVYAGALGGAANAAVHDGNILEGALTGGAMGYVGGLAGQAAAGAGAGNILAGAAGGAAAGATGSLLTGQDILKGALSGGAMGGLSGLAYDYILKPDGSVAPIEDKSSWSSDAIREQNAQGNTVKINGADGRVSYYTPDGALTTVNADGSTWTQDLDGNVTIRTSDGGLYKQDLNGTQTFTGKIYTYDDGSTLTVDVDGNPVSSTPATDNPNPAVPNTNIVGGDQAGSPAGTVPVPTTPVFPVITTPGGTTTPEPATTTPSTPVSYLPVSPVNLPPGINPGFIEPTPFYHTTNDAQSQFYWGEHPFQAGPGFNARLYNMSNAAPTTPWGLQNIAQPLTPDEVRQAYQGQPIVQPPTQVATRIEQPLSVYLQDHFNQQANLPRQMVPPANVVATSPQATTTQGLPVLEVPFITGPAVPAPVVVQG